MAARVVNGAPRRPGVWGSVRPSRGASRALLGVVSAATVADLVLTVSGGGVSHRTLIAFGISGSFLLFAWHPIFAASLLAALGGLTLALGTGAVSVLMAAVGSGLVVALCGSGVIVSYALAVAAMSVAVELTSQGGAPGAAVAIVAVGVASALVGGVFRRMSARTSALAAEAERLARAAAEAVREERERIADELHDVVARNLTVAAMQARLLQRDAGRPAGTTSTAGSAAEVVRATTQALADIRRLVRLVGGPSADDPSGILPDSLPLVLEQCARQLRSTGRSTEANVRLDHPLSASVATAVARVAGEATANVIAHGAMRGSVRIAAHTDDTSVTLAYWNSTDEAVPARDAAGGYGLRRMSERVHALEGELTAGPVAGGWELRARLPLR